MNTLQKILVLSAAFGVFIGLWLTQIPHKALPRYAPPDAVANDDPMPVFESRWVTNYETTETHSANIAIVQDVPVTVWYGGTEEGHKDVAVFMSRFEAGGWSPPEVITNRAMAEAGLGRYIRKLGNPAIHAWPDGSLGLYFVTVSFAGWAASNITYMESPDVGKTWGAPKRLVTSPFLNISTLVRTDGLNLVGGDLSLPVYHEMAGKFSETLHLGRDQTVLDKVRISRGKHSLQPAIASVDETHATAILRYAGAEPYRLLSAKTLDGGLHWTHPEKLDIPNPNAAVATINLGDGRLLMALNDLEDGRHKLSLALYESGEWRLIKTLEAEYAYNPVREYQFSYPSFAMDADGFIHLVYTWNVERIRHLRFNKAWLIMPDPTESRL